MTSLVTEAERISRQVVTYQRDGCHSVDRKLDRILTSKGTGISGDAAAPGTGVLDHHRWGELFHPSWLSDRPVLGGRTAAPSSLWRSTHRPGSTGYWWTGCLPCAGLGGVGDAAAHGHLLPAVHPAGGCRAICRGWPSIWTNAFQKCLRLRQAEPSPCAWASAATPRGVVGCRIIDSPRERLMAILTNSFVPCNGRFPTLIALITLFFLGARRRACAPPCCPPLLLTAGHPAGAVGMTFARLPAAVRKPS